MPANVRLLALLTLAHLVVDAYASSVPALLPFWQERFGLTYALAGLIRTVSDVTSSVAQPLIGILTDRGRNPRWIAIATLLAAVGVSLTGLVPVYLGFIACVVAGGLGVSAFHPQGYKLVGQHAGRAQATATSWFLVGGNLGVAIGPLIGTATVLTFGLSGTALLFLPGAACAALLGWLVPRWASAPRRRAAAARTALGSDQPAPDATVPSGKAEAQSDASPDGEITGVMRLAPRRRLVAVVVLVAMVALRTTVTSALISFVPLYYVRIAGTSESVASGVLAGMLFAGAVATIPGGWLADRFGRLRLLAVSLAPVPPLLLLFLALPPGAPLAAAALWTTGALITGSFAVTVVLAQELWFERRALASGLIVGSAFGLGGLLVPFIGAAADRWGLPFALQLLAAVPLASLALLAVLSAILAPAWDGTKAGGHN